MIEILPNNPPVFTSTALTSVDDNAKYTYEFTATDPESDEVTFSATTKPDWLRLNTGPTEVTTLAGSGSTDGNGTGISADGTGTNASFGRAGALVVDGSGNVYIADTKTSEVKKMDSEGVVTTIAGTGSYEHIDGTGTNAGFSGINGMAMDSQGNMYITSNNSIRKLTPQGVVSTFVGPTNG